MRSLKSRVSAGAAIVDLRSQVDAKGNASACSIADDAERFMTPAEAAAFIGLAEQTLAIDRITGRLGLPFHKFGRAVRYRRADLIAWAAARIRRHTSDPGEAARA